MLFMTEHFKAQVANAREEQQMSNENETQTEVVGDVKYLIEKAERSLSGLEWGQSDPDAEGSTAYSLLAIAKMLQSTIERERTNDALIAENYRMDTTLGKLGDDLRALAGDLPAGTSGRLGDILREAGL